MPKKRGDVQKVGIKGTARQRMWNSIGILRRFTSHDLARTSDAKIDNVRRALQSLERHGFIRVNTGYRGGRPGAHKIYSLVRRPGPDYPVYCEKCGRNLGFPCEPAGENLD